MKSTPTIAPMADNKLRKQIESIKRQKIASNKVVNLAEYRDLSDKVDVTNILVVDDDEIMRAALKRILDGEGYNVILAADGLELSKILENNKLDIILLDVNLPWVDGYELCRLIKSHGNLSGIPVVMVSARKTQEDIQLGFDAGCNDYVTKPFDIDGITSVIHKMLPKSV